MLYRSVFRTGRLRVFINLKVYFMKQFSLFFAILLSVGLQFVCAQTREITGRVTSAEDGSSIPGVSVIVKGTIAGSITDIDGNYRITVPEDARILQFSFVGMETQEAEIGRRTTINIQLKSATIGVDEVIVVGYGKQIKSELTGAIAKVDIGELQRVPSPTFETSLQGKTPGVFIEKGTGKLGEGIKIRVRGTSSLSASNQPLYVVDGVVVTSQDQGIETNQPVNPIADLNFDDIESIQILKDASAAAIYGSRGSNGVVIITTKSGKKNQPTRVHVGYSLSLSSESEATPFLNTAQFVELVGESLENAGWADAGMGETEILSWAGYAPGDVLPDTDWNDTMFRDAVSHKYNASVIGGDKNTQFYVGMSYDDQEGILVANDYTRMSGRLNLDHTVNEKLQIGAKFNLVKSDLYRVSNDNAFATPMQLIAHAPFFEPYIDGEPNGDTFYYNSLLSIKYDTDETRIYRAFANAYLNYTLIEGLTFHSIFGLDNMTQRENQYQSRKTDDGSPAGKSYLRNVNVLNWTFDNYFTYDKTFTEDHVMQLVGGMSAQESNTFMSFVGGQTFPSDYFQTLSSAAENDGYDSEETGYSYLSFFLRGNYKLMDKYLLSASFRTDGSSKFGKDNRYGNFYSASVGWVLSKEEFLASSQWISFLKVRASYGLTGNSEIEDFGALGLYDGYSYAGKPALSPEQLENRGLSWENTRQYDIGIDFGFWDNRVNGEIDFYRKNTEDLLLSRLLPYTTGFASITENVGELRNQGIEFAINSSNITGDFTWNTSFNIATNDNEITKIVAPMTFARNRVEEGEPIGIFYMRKYAGVDPANGDALYYLEEGSDQTTNSYSEAADMKVGDPNPDFYGGLTNSFTYKGFDLRLFLQFVYGNDIYNDAGRFMSANGDWVDNQTRDQMGRWQNPGDITDIPQARFGESNGTRHSSRYIYDGSYLRLKDITLGYTLPKKVSERFNINRARFYVTALNLLTWTDFPLYDPEVNHPGVDRTTTEENIRQGIWYYSTPQSKTFTFGVSLTF